MIACSRLTSSAGRLCLAALLGVGLLAPAPGVAQDQDEFYAIARGENGRSRTASAPARQGFNFFGLFGGGNRRDVPEITVRPGEASTAPRTDNAAQGRSASGENIGGPRAYCVRTCDGFFFPMGPITQGAAREAQQANCQAMCPGTEAVLYSVARQGSIEEATNGRGQAYASLATAFRFRQGLDRACTCQGSAANGLARLPITQDPTLKPGDIVVTDEGAQVFRGGARFPYRAQDFVSARAYGRLPPDMKRRVEEIEAGLATAGARADTAGPTPAVMEVPPTPGLSPPPATMAGAVVRVIDISQNRSLPVR